MIKADILQRIGHGKYQIGKTQLFTPQIIPENIALYQQIKTQFPFIDCCIWNINDVKSFSLHVSFVNFHLLEVERDAVEAVFQYVKEFRKKVFLKPSRKIIEEYLLDLEDVLIVQPLITEAPLQVIEEVSTTTLEKMLVDLVSNKRLFYFYQGNELTHIFRYAFDNYTINESRLLRYAGRRKKKKVVLELLNTIKRH